MSDWLERRVEELEETNRQHLVEIERLKAENARLMELCTELDMEMDGRVTVPASAAAIFNTLRSIVSE